MNWYKKAKQFHIPKTIDLNDPTLDSKLEEAYFVAWDDYQEYMKGEWMILSPELKNYIIGRAFLRGWEDASNGKPRQIPPDLKEYAKNELV